VSSRTSARLAWSICGVSFAVVAAGLLLFILNRSTVDASSVFLTVVYAPALTYSMLGALIAARRPENPIGWMLAGFGLVSALLFFTGEYAIRGFVTAPGSLPAATVMAWLNNWIYYPNIWIVIPLFFLLFPGGRPPSQRWMPLAWLVIALACLQAIVVILTPSVIVGSNQGQNHLHNLVMNPTGVGHLGGAISSLRGLLPVVLLGTATVCFAAFIRRFFGSRGDERQQLKWVAWVGAVVLVVNLLALTFQSGWESDVLFLVNSFGLAIGIPGAAALAILKYRLYDIDVIINRTLVYGALAAFITAVYVAVVVGLGALIRSGGQPNLALSIAATAVVALAFQPVRAWVERAANMLVYGRRATPYEVLAQFSHRVAGAYANEEVLPRLARVLGEGTGAASASVWITGSGERVSVATWPAEAQPVGPEGTDRMATVRHQGEELGWLAVKKRPGEQVTPVENKLLNDLAAQAGQVLRNVRLTADLQARLEQISTQAADLRESRQRIVAAQDAERRRLERNIHDGAQQHLVALAVKLRLTASQAKKDSDRAVQSIDELRRQTRDALETLSTLAAGLNPPVLRDRGIAAALTNHTGSGAIAVQVQDGCTRRYPEELEAAVYFCCQEAIQNAVKHARASRVRVQLTEEDGALAFSVADNGAGFDATTAARGAGMQNMSDRIAAVGGSLRVDSAPGGGTTVRGRVPIPVLASP